VGCDVKERISWAATSSVTQEPALERCVRSKASNRNRTQRRVRGQRGERRVCVPGMMADFATNKGYSPRLLARRSDNFQVYCIFFYICLACTLPPFSPSFAASCAYRERNQVPCRMMPPCYSGAGPIYSRIERHRNAPDHHSASIICTRSRTPGVA
jgi:hypothetical protein